MESSDPAALTGAQLDTATSLMLEAWESLRFPLPPSVLVSEELILELYHVFTLSPDSDRVDQVTRTLYGYLMVLGVKRMGTKRDARAKAWCKSTGRIMCSFLLSVCDF